MENQIGFDFAPPDQSAGAVWKNMPAYDNIEVPEPFITSTFKFRTEEDFKEFTKLVRKYVYNDIKYIDGFQKTYEKQAWYPLSERQMDYYYKSDQDVTPRFPIYIVSKNRWERNPTSRALTKMGLPFKMIIEQNQLEHYKGLMETLGLDESSLLILPQKYLDDYDVFWKDDDPRTGPGAARNFAWDHSIENGYDRHWVLDDNIEHFYRFNGNAINPCLDGSPFYITEDLVLRYTNVAIAGLQYDMFVPVRQYIPPVTLNTRIYSCLLIKNDIPYRWRGRYNEDTDICLRVLKDGLCTLQVNALLQKKRGTQSVKGGNTEEFYAGEGTLNKSQMLVDMHPDVTELIWRYNRWHHEVNYKPFKKNELILKEGITIPDGENNYGLVRHKKES